MWVEITARVKSTRLVEDFWPNVGGAQISSIQMHPNIKFTFQMSPSSFLFCPYITV